MTPWLPDWDGWLRVVLLNVVVVFVLWLLGLYP
jgi:hypothetical protein